MRLKAIVCQVFAHEIRLAASRSSHQLDVEVQPIGMHELGDAMRARLQERIDAADGQGYDAIVLGYSLCGRGTEGLRAGKTPVVLPRAHDCIDILMGGHSKSMAFFETHKGVYYRSPGWVEFLEASRKLQPDAEKNVFGGPLPLREVMARRGDKNGRHLYAEFGEGGEEEERLTYISTGVPGDDQFLRGAREEAEAEHRQFEECKGSIEVLERLVVGEWNPEEFLIIPPGSSVRAVLGTQIVDLS